MRMSVSTMRKSGHIKTALQLTLFAERLSSLRRGDLNWLASTPDLTRYDFCLWGYLQAEVDFARCHNKRNRRNQGRSIRENDTEFTESFEGMTTEPWPSFGQYNFQNLKTVNGWKFWKKNVSLKIRLC